MRNGTLAWDGKERDVSFFAKEHIETADAICELNGHEGCRYVTCKVLRRGIEQAQVGNGISFIGISSEFMWKAKPYQLCKWIYRIRGWTHSALRGSGKRLSYIRMHDHPKRNEDEHNCLKDQDRRVRPDDTCGRCSVGCRFGPYLTSIGKS